MKKHVVVMGLGYVGFPLACAISRSQKYEVIGFDIDEQKIAMISEGTYSVDDPWSAEVFSQFPFTTTSNASCLAGAEIVLVSVPTPVYEDYTPNLDPLLSACRLLTTHGKRGADIIIESTINPGVCDEVLIPYFENAGRVLGRDFALAHCPERINPGDAQWNVMNIPRNIGASDEKTLIRLAEFYRSFLDAEIYEMSDLKHVEATKIVENTFRDINIAFVNELAKSFDLLGLDVHAVISAAGNKPFAFMKHFPSCGVGGHCIPVDPYYLIERAKEKGFTHSFLSLARQINNSMPAYTVQVLMRELNKQSRSLKGTPIGLLGLSYKANVGDMRNSPAAHIRELLREYEADIFTFDPYVPSLSTESTLDSCLAKSDVLVVATGHTLFKERLSSEYLKKYAISLLIDGSNTLQKERFMSSDIVYKGIGR